MTETATGLTAWERLQHRKLVQWMLAHAGLRASRRDLRSSLESAKLITKRGGS
jgi:hypothetical protein